MSTFPFYFMLYAVVSTGIAGDGVRQAADYGLPVALIIVLLIVGRAAWAHEEAPAAPDGLVRTLWPWR